MRVTLCCLVFLLQLSAESCVVPTPVEMANFFEGNQYWTEVESQDSFVLAKKSPVFLIIGINDLSLTSVSWGKNKIAGDEISICWKSPDKKIIQIGKGFFRTNLSKIGKDRLKSRDPFNGTLYYRKHSLVRSGNNLLCNNKKSLDSSNKACLRQPSNQKK